MSKAVSQNNKATYHLKVKNPNRSAEYYHQLRCKQCFHNNINFVNAIIFIQILFFMCHDFISFISFSRVIGIQ